MKLKIYLRPEAHKFVAKGERLWSWHFITLPIIEGELVYEDVKSDHTYLGEFNCTLPSPEEAVHVALAELKRKEKEIQLQAASDLRDVAEARSKLLSLTYQPAAPEAFDDIPF